MSEVQGHCDPRFARVRAAFEENFAAHGEVGAALAIFVGGQLVVELWGGLASRAEGTPWSRDTLVNVYSTTKGLAALCAHRLVDGGLVDLDDPIARHWPEFAAHDKGRITLRQLLAHRAGVPALRARLPHEALYDQTRMAEALADETPFWQPGVAHGYHVQTFGFVLAELVRRVTNTTLGRYFAREIAGPLDADVHIGLAAEHDARVARVTRPLGEALPPGELDMVSVFQREPDSLTTLAFGNPAPSPGAANTRAYRAAEIPSSNGHASAIGLARVYAPLARGGTSSGGVRLLAPESIARCHSEHSFGEDLVLRRTTRFGLGFMLSQASGGGYFSPNAEAFGHPGMGGSFAFADPVAGVAFGYVMNRAGMNILVGERPRRLVDALYQCI